MTPFSDVLRTLGLRLDLPQPAKSRILLEVAGDLHDLYQHYRSQGIAEDAARERAIAMMDFSDEALDELIRLHQSTWTRLLDRLSMRPQLRWERAALLVTFCFILLFAGRQILLTDLAVFASGFKWPALVTSAACAFLILSKAFDLFVRKKHEPRRARSNLATILLLASATLLIGLVGSAVELHQMLAQSAADIDHAGFYVLWGLLETSALLVLSLTSGVLSLMLWFALVGKATAIEQAEVAVLLAE